MLELSSGDNFSLNDISINSIKKLDENKDFRYVYVLSCHGSELLTANERRDTYPNEDCFFDTIGFANKFGLFGYTDAPNIQITNLQQQNYDPITSPNINNFDMINRFRIVDGSLNSDLNVNPNCFYVNGLMHRDILPHDSIDDNNEIITLNPMNFEIKRSDYSNTQTNRFFIDNFGLIFFKVYTFRAALNNTKNIDINIATQMRQVKSIQDIPELHDYFNSNSTRRDLLYSGMSQVNKERITSDIRYYMEPDKKNSWNTILKMCYQDIREQNLDINNHNFDLRAFCCRKIQEGQASSISAYVVNSLYKNYIPVEITNEDEDLDFTPFFQKKTLSEDMDIFAGNLNNYLYDIYNRCVDKDVNINLPVNSNITHFSVGNYKLLLVTLISSFEYTPYINDNRFRTLFKRLYSSTINETSISENYDLFEVLLTMTGNKRGHQQYMRKKVSLLGNPTNKNIYLNELAQQVSIASNIEYNGYNSKQFVDGIFANYGYGNMYNNIPITETILMLSKDENFMNDHNQILTQDENAMDVENNSHLKDLYLQFNLNELINRCGYLGIIADDFYEFFNEYLDEAVFMYFTATKQVDNTVIDENLDEALFVLIMKINQYNTGIFLESYLIGIDSNNFRDNERFVTYNNRERYQITDLDESLKEGINMLLFYGFLVPLYNNQFNYIDFIYRIKKENMSGGGPKRVKPNIKNIEPFKININYNVDPLTNQTTIEKNPSTKIQSDDKIDDDMDVEIFDDLKEIPELKFEKDSNKEISPPIPTNEYAPGPFPLNFDPNYSDLGFGPDIEIQQPLSPKSPNKDSQGTQGTDPEFSTPRTPRGSQSTTTIFRQRTPERTQSLPLIVTPQSAMSGTTSIESPYSPPQRRLPGTKSLSLLNPDFRRNPPLRNPPLRKGPSSPGRSGPSIFSVESDEDIASQNPFPPIDPEASSGNNTDNSDVGMDLSDSDVETRRKLPPGPTGGKKQKANSKKISRKNYVPIITSKKIKLTKKCYHKEKEFCNLDKSKCSTYKCKPKNSKKQTKKKNKK